MQEKIIGLKQQLIKFLSNFVSADELPGEKTLKQIGTKQIS